MRRRSGQVVVETAIIMPVFVFLVLGLLQLSLMHQARVMTKYAAYKAVRAGALRGAQKPMMENAALAVLLPVAGRDSQRGAFFPTNDSGNLRNAWSQMSRNQQEGGLKVAEVTICNPTRGSLPNPEQQDFDDPHTLTAGQKPSDNQGGSEGSSGDEEETGGGGEENSWRQFDGNKLMAQVTLFYRLNIPFANWMIFRIAFAEEKSANYQKMRRLAYDKNMSRASNSGGRVNPRDSDIDQKLKSAADNRKYIMPIRASYAMRMQSNLVARDLPSRNDCKISWRKQ
ncbi:MAG: pilus assembly protein [Myxococcaceae bacterium]|nr:pilus assembly protein [Myxococcaceae bacterium]MCA3015813.1 pilus assembly protein [Myxococcaceae bacterium]